MDKKIKRTPTADYWANELESKLEDQFVGFIEDFEKDIFFKKQGKIEDKLFAETRLRMGAYGQRYDNGKRSDGKEIRSIPFPEGLAKGPETDWHAPGMLRIKIPYGGMTPEQVEMHADLSEEYSDGISHITTRQDIQFHFIHIEDTPTLFRRLASVGITTREACGNSIRNVTACPYIGVCSTESFNSNPHADAIFRYLLGHPDVQDFGRKFKIAVSGCADHPCGLTTMHDLGIIAKMQEGHRGFEVQVGGGLGAVPHKAKTLTDFVPEAELLPLIQAVCRIYARYGEKKIRNRSRVKFLVADWGIEKFQKEVQEEFKSLPKEEKWTEFLNKINQFEESPLKDPGKEIPSGDAAYQRWVDHNVRKQKQSGYAVVTIACPLGDVTASQMRSLADIARTYTKGTIRTTVEQNFVLRWVSLEDLPHVYEDLKASQLAQPFADTIVDITACPGTDTCKLGVSASRGLAGELRRRLAEKSAEFDLSVAGLKIKVSGCFNSCGQQHLSDIGFFGISRKKSGFVVPHFQMLLGGQMANNGAEYGLSMMAFPSKSIPEVVERLTGMYLSEKENKEPFRKYVERVGKVHIKKALDDLTKIPDPETDKSYFMDWGDIREYSVADKGIGECAGEVVKLSDFGLQTAEREVFDAQIAFDAGDFEKASKVAYTAMKRAAQALIKYFNPDISEDPDRVALEFKKRLVETELFQDPFQGDKFAKYYFKHHEQRNDPVNQESADIVLREVQLFIEAAHACNLRMSQEGVASQKDMVIQ